LTAKADTEALARADLAFFDGLLDMDIPALESLLAEEFLLVDVASGQWLPWSLLAVDGLLAVRLAR
jgi:hypothetical protein